MSAHVLLNLLNELRKRDKMRGLPTFFFATSLTKYRNTHQDFVIFYATL